MENQNTDLTIAEIQKKMQESGFPEMEWLWKRFLKLGIGLSEINDADVEHSRLKHMNTLMSHPVIMCFLSAVVVVLAFFNLRDVIFRFSEAWPPITDIIMACIFSLLSVYLFWFILTLIQRTFIHPWKDITAMDLAAMLKRKSYMKWLNSTEQASAVTARLRRWGVNETWDNPEYRIWYLQGEGKIEKTEPVPETVFIQNTLREVLGSKQDRKFRPGKYVDSLNSLKKSVTRFIKAHGEAVNRNKEGTLSVDEGIHLLQSLKDTEVKTGSAGARYLEDAITMLESDLFLPKGNVEAFIWNRDPWTDLTHSRDFYSSASLRGNSFMDMLERRSKGMLGPFGYLRNKSICALDFRTAEGRSVRARLAAAVYHDRNGNEQPLLFVDAVEGRFNIKPALIKKAIEDYAGECGFNMVFYYRYPLNLVPKRFINHLSGSEASLEELTISYADASRREYLDVFGFPFEPFEYAYPKGITTGYAVNTVGGMDRNPVVPGKIKVWLNLAKARSLLWCMVITSFASLGWVLYRLEPDWLIPAGIFLGVVILYDRFIHRRIRGRVVGTKTN